MLLGFFLTTTAFDRAVYNKKKTTLKMLKGKSYLYWDTHGCYQTYTNINIPKVISTF